MYYGHNPQFPDNFMWGASSAAWQVEGTPADCTRLGLRALAQEPVDLVISGINDGWNLGLLTYVSGTVAAAREAAFLGYPALAVSAGCCRHKRWSMSTCPPAPLPGCAPHGYALSPPYMTARATPAGTATGAASTSAAIWN